ncbi:hypothetical protein [Caryophanon tenue]|uniref:Uncharacterized protein n=1 Tax=Caryophanon tenue TaxID=33978 RepID=A0A1C0YIU0_9BACL|nr:hypothetical protein [Caryophanon tenue]OCS87088.1 hypothetical protein A6M13_11470 [Caryophanon tenue]
MKHTRLLTTAVAVLLLTGCNSSEETQTDEQPEEVEVAPVEPEVEMPEQENPDVTDTNEEGDASTEEEDELQQAVPPIAQQPDEEEDVTQTEPPHTAGEESDTEEAQPAPSVTKEEGQLLLYQGNANADGLIASQAVDYSYKENGSITKYIIDQLGYTTYYASHNVSADETTITINFNDSILSSPVIQGSAGGLMFQDSLLASLFQNIPTLQNVNLRVNGEKMELDHVNFSGTHTREAFNMNYAGL